MTLDKTLEWEGPSTRRTDAILAGEIELLPERERRRRRAALADAASAAGCDLVLVYGADRSGSGVPWLTGWGVTREAVLLVDLAADDADVMFVQFHNHLRLASELARGCEVRWGGPVTGDTLVEELRRRGAAMRGVGVVGPVGHGLHRRLAAQCRDVVDIGAAYTRLRLVKSPHELDLLVAGASLSDRAAAAMFAAARPGATDHDLVAAVEQAYVPLGGTTHIHYLAITSMASPDRPVPAQLPLGRVLAEGDVVLTELSAAFAGYAGQVLRTMTPDDALTSRYQELHDVASAAFDAIVAAVAPGVPARDLVAAASVIEDAGFTTIDDLVHGFGGGYLPPVLGSASRPAGPLPDLVLEAGMTIVVQPNVVDRDGRAGVQTGELIAVTGAGAVSLHGAPAGPWVGAGHEHGAGETR